MINVIVEFWVLPYVFRSSGPWDLQHLDEEKNLKNPGGDISGTP